MNEVKVRAQCEPWNPDKIGLLIKQGKEVCINLVMKEFEPGATLEPSFVLDYAAAQVLMDDLWTSGLRPTEGKGSAGAMKAVQYHLEDMRKIAFAKINIKETP